jgi:hypothetical protein
MPSVKFHRSATIGTSPEFAHAGISNVWPRLVSESMERNFVEIPPVEPLAALFAVLEMLLL